MPRLRLVSLLLAGTLIGGCGAEDSSASPPTSVASTAGDRPAPQIDDPMVQRACQFGAVVFDVGPVALCAAAIDLAVQRLGLVRGPITAISFRLQLCPPNARCQAPTMKEGWVIVTFTTGAPVMVHVGPVLAVGGVDGPLVADGPQEVPAWLAAEVAGAAGQR